jgi:hypothetical protein
MYVCVVLKKNNSIKKNHARKDASKRAVAFLENNILKKETF